MCLKRVGEDHFWYVMDAAWEQGGVYYTNPTHGELVYHQGEAVIGVVQKDLPNEPAHFLVSKGGHHGA